MEDLTTNMSFKHNQKKTKEVTIFKWDIIKIHAISHFAADIKRSGATSQYSAEVYEFLHQQVL